MGYRPTHVLGAHLSVAGGLERALLEAGALGCECVQIFVKNQRQWRAGPLTADQIERFRQARNAMCVTPVVAHASYLLNLASPDKQVRQRSRDAMIDELERCEALGVDYLVFHPGAHLNAEVQSSKSKDRKQSRGCEGAGSGLSNVDCRLSNERTHIQKAIPRPFFEWVRGSQFDI